MSLGNTKRLFLILTITLITLITLELGCYFFLENRLNLMLINYFSENDDLQILENLEDKIVDPFNLNKGAPRAAHPYFGYTRPLTKQNAALDSLTYGFVERPELLKLQRQENTYNVGIFGGSVAAQLTFFEQKNNILKNILKSKISSLKNKKIRIISFSYSGYRQPQQFILSTFFAKKLDLSINIEGANELDSDPTPKFPTYYPPIFISQLFFSKNIFESSDLQHSILNKYKSFKKWTTRLKHWRQSSLIRSVIKTKVLVLKKGIISAVKEKQEREEVFLQRLSLEDNIKKRASTWEHFVKLQNIVANSTNTMALFFLQPVPYYGNKELSLEELNLVARLTNKKKQELQLGYRHFVEVQGRLRASEVTIENLTGVFDQTKDTVFVDECCHLNELGNQRLIEKIGEYLIQKIENNAKK